MNVMYLHIYLFCEYFTTYPAQLINCQPTAYYVRPRE